jgi:Mg2+ and Co2+ transporter CorA
MTFAIFFEKTFWLIISLVSTLFVLITKLGYKSILADCETRSLLTEKNLREEFKKELKEIRDEMKKEFEKIDRHEKRGNDQIKLYLEQIMTKLNQKQ